MKLSCILMKIWSLSWIMAKFFGANTQMLSKVVKVCMIQWSRQEIHLSGLERPLNQNALPSGSPPLPSEVSSSSSRRRWPAGSLNLRWRWWQLFWKASVTENVIDISAGNLWPFHSPRTWFCWSAIAREAHVTDGCTRTVSWPPRCDAWPISVRTPPLESSWSMKIYNICWLWRWQ